MWRWNIFITYRRNDVFQNLSILRARVITSDDDGYPNGSKYIPILVETRAKQGLPYKGGGTEIDLGKVGEEWMGIPKLRVSYRWHYISIQIELDGEIVSERLKGQS